MEVKYLKKSHKNCKCCDQEFPNTDTYFKGARCIGCNALIEVSLKNAKERAERYGRDFELDEDWVLQQYAKQNMQCWWTGQDFDFSKSLRPRVANPNALTIDRIVNDEGYTKENSVVCVNWFNKFKNKYSIPELNYMLMGCVSAYSKIQQMFVPSSTVPFHQLDNDKISEEFNLPITKEEKDNLMKDIEAGHYDPFGKFHPGTKRLLEVVFENVEEDGEDDN